MMTRANIFLDFVDGVVGIATKLPGTAGLAAGILGAALDALDLFNCTGPVAIDNVIYVQADLNKMDQNQKICDTKPYSFEKTGSCLITSLGGNSSYTVKYCLEALDPKPAAKENGAANLFPFSLLSFAGFGVALLYGSYELLV
jgi:hypothetical protein